MTEFPTIRSDRASAHARTAISPNAVVVIGKLVRRGDVVVCEGLAYGLALACRRSEPVIVSFGSAGWSSLATAVGLGEFAEVILAPTASRAGREAADALHRRVLAYGGRKRAPHVRAARDRTVTVGALPYADPRRLKKLTQSYLDSGLPRWEAARLAYTKVTARRIRWSGVYR